MHKGIFGLIAVAIAAVNIALIGFGVWAVYTLVMWVASK